jgi:hypothetical protein
MIIMYLIRAKPYDSTVTRRKYPEKIGKPGISGITPYLAAKVVSALS